MRATTPARRWTGVSCSCGNAGMALALVLSLPALPSMTLTAPQQLSSTSPPLAAGDLGAPVSPEGPQAKPMPSAAGCMAPQRVLRAEPRFEPTIKEMWRRSPTFRRQVARLAAGGLLVTIQSCLTKCPNTARAQTIMSYRHDLLAGADVRIPFRPSQEPELIAHELEHVIEQLEGVNLARLASTRTREVHVDTSGRYETVRAQHVGRLAATEYRAAVAAPSVCESATP
jgi:hypothetical protein